MAEALTKRLQLTSVKSRESIECSELKTLEYITVRKSMLFSMHIVTATMSYMGCSGVIKLYIKSHRHVGGIFSMNVD